MISRGLSLDSVNIKALNIVRVYSLHADLTALTIPSMRIITAQAAHSCPSSFHHYQQPKPYPIGGPEL